MTKEPPYQYGYRTYEDGYCHKEGNIFLKGSDESKEYGKGWLQAGRDDKAMYGVRCVPLSEADTFLRVR